MLQEEEEDIYCEVTMKKTDLIGLQASEREEEQGDAFRLSLTKKKEHCGPLKREAINQRIWQLLDGIVNRTGH